LLLCLQALLPVPSALQLPRRLHALWSGGRCFSSTCWPTMFAVKALSNCNLMVLSRDKFVELVKEYQWVGRGKGSGRGCGWGECVQCILVL
jgi:hypothetical protein